MKKRAWLCLLAAVVMLAGCKDKAKDKTQEESTSSNQIEEETQEEEDPNGQIELPGKLSDFAFAIDGEEYSLPMSIEALNTLGWTYDGDDTKSMDAESFLEGKSIKRGKTALTADIVNPKGEPQPIAGCFMGGIIIDLRENKDMQVKLPGEIVMGRSTLDDVLDAYGQPTDQYEEKDAIFLTYEYGIYKKADLLFDAQEEVLYKIDWKNYRSPDSEGEAGEVSRTPPKEVERYTRPEGLQGDISEFAVEYGGFYYQIPAPVSEFIKNGWSILEEGSDKSVEAGRHGYVSLEKDGQRLYGVAANYSDVSVVIENSFLTTVHGDFDTTKVPIKIYKGITLGMDEENVKALLEGVTYETKEEDGILNYYYYAEEEKLDYVKISIDQNLGLVREIELNNNPDSLPQIEGEQGNEGDSVDATAMYMPEEPPEEDNVPASTLPDDSDEKGESE